MGRPIGVTILGVLMIAAGIGFAAAGFIFFFMGSTGAMTTASASGLGAALLAALGAAAGVIFLLFGGLHVALAVGILKMRNIARILTIFLFLLIGAGACLGLIATLLRYSHVGLAWNISLLVVDALVLGYLYRAKTKQAFNA
ncbi:MAG TPA: hypothetical protein VNI36_01405 [Candidatus Dormibacteraeota bacterium]|nr:hypothetical protein [Candidatus Dormibacteraeota bacterium]